jgi:hypothetical protein
MSGSVVAETSSTISLGSIRLIEKRLVKGGYVGLAKSRNSRTIFEGMKPRIIAGSAGEAPTVAPAGTVPADWGGPIRAERLSGVAMLAAMLKLMGPA